MRVFSIASEAILESDQLPQFLPANGFVWVALARREFEWMQSEVQRMLQALCDSQLVDLHIADMLNNQLPSHYDYTSQYDMLVFRRLAAGSTESDLSRPGEILHRSHAKAGMNALRRIDTSPVAFAVFDRLLLTVHPVDCAVRDSFASRMLAAFHANLLTSSARVPHSPADLMLRIISQMVDGYLNLRRDITRQLDQWQSQLLRPDGRFSDWSALLDARLMLHHLDEICEDQRAAIQDWTDGLESLKSESSHSDRALELLKVRSRDVLEHIERVVHHVRRLEQSAETSVQMHFSAQSNRTNAIMRTLTVLTAVFLPLNLITGFFGMNFEHFEFVHLEHGLEATLLLMAAVGAGLLFFFWRKRYLGSAH